MDCAVSEFIFNELASSPSAGWLAISAFRTATRLLIKDFFWTDMAATLSVCAANCWIISIIARGYDKLVTSPDISIHRFFFMAIKAGLALWRLSALAVKTFASPMG